MTGPRDAAVEALSTTLLRLHPTEAAALLESASLADTEALLRSLSPPQAAAVVRRLSPHRARPIIVGQGGEGIVEELEAQHAAMLLAGLEPVERQTVLGRMAPGHASELTRLGEYPPETAGSIMDPRVLAVRGGVTVSETVELLRDFPRNARRVFVVDGEGVLVGWVRIRDLVTAAPDQTLASMADPNWACVQATASRAEVVALAESRGTSTVGVLDFSGRLLGVIRSDELLHAAERVVSESALAMVGAGREERALSSVGLAVRKRLPWLQVNLLTAFLAAAVVGAFESTIAQFTALAVLLPVVAGQSGNTGAQALAVTMRGLALREVGVRQWGRVAFKEVRVAFLNGVAVAITTSAAVFLWSGSQGLALVIGSSMVVSMVMAGLAGAAIPMALTALRQDPAQSASIVLTTVTDVAGFLSFLGTATLLSSIL